MEAVYTAVGSAETNPEITSEAYYLDGVTATDEVDGDYICEDCLNNEAAWCDCCHSYHYMENMHYIEKNCEVIWYCKDCWEEMEENG